MEQFPSSFPSQPPTTPVRATRLQRHSVVNAAERAASLVRLRQHRWRNHANVRQPSSLSTGLASWESEGGQLHKDRATLPSPAGQRS